MKTSIVSQTNKRIATYPCFKIMVPGDKSGSTPGSELVVLFTDDRTGVAIHSNCEESPVGDRSDRWIDAENREVWDDFIGTIKVE